MSTISLKDHATDKMVTLEFLNIKTIASITLTCMLVELHDAGPITYDIGLDGMRLVKQWLLEQIAQQSTTPQRTLAAQQMAFYAEKLGMPYEPPRFNEQRAMPDRRRGTGLALRTVERRHVQRRKGDAQ
jgi:hypothetical protein